MKYTWAVWAMPDIRVLAHGCVRLFHPTCGTFSSDWRAVALVDDVGVGQTDAHSRDESEPAHTRRFGAALVQPLHAEANPEDRAAAIDRGLNRVAPFDGHRVRGGKVADARDDHAVDGRQFRRTRRA